MNENGRFERMWSILERLKREEYVLLLDEQQRICWFQPKDEVKSDIPTDRSSYDHWGSLTDRASVEDLTRDEMIVRILDPGPGRRNRPCFELGQRGRKALKEKERASSDRCERLWIVTYQRDSYTDAYPYVGVARPDPKSVVGAHQLGPLDERARFGINGPFDLEAVQINSLLMNAVGPLASSA